MESAKPTALPYDIINSSFLQIRADIPNLRRVVQNLNGFLLPVDDFRVKYFRDFFYSFGIVFVLHFIDKLSHETFSDVGKHKIRGNFVKASHLWRIWKSLKYSQSKGQSFFNFGVLLPEFQLLQLLYVLVEFEVVQNNCDEQAEHDLSVKVQ